MDRYESAVLEDRQVLFHRGAGHGKIVGNFGDRHIASAQVHEDGPPGRIGKRPEGALNVVGHGFTGRKSKLPS